MTVPSFQFLLFAAVIAGLFNLAPRGLRPAVQLLANLAFLASFSRAPAAFIPFAGFLAFGYASVVLLQRGWTRPFWALVAITLLLFFWLKKYTFIPPQIWLAHPYLTIGLSYVFFRVLHLIIDARSGDLPERVGLLDYANYTLDFTCIVAGPIQLYQDYKASAEPLTQFRAGAAIERIAIGFFKVFIVAAILDALHKQAIHDLPAAAGEGQRLLDGLLIVGLYPLYLYANFSGYTDVVIGVARFLRRRLPENFNKPFSSKNFIEFWSRWHISLSSWLKTYVYNPLIMSLMRRVTWRPVEPFLAVVAFFVTFFLVGAWHGQTGEFLFFGLLQGGGVAANKVYQILMAGWLGRKGYRELSANRLYGAVCRGLTFAWFGFTLLWFWSRWGDIRSVGETLGPAGVAGAMALLTVIATVVLELLVTIGEAAAARPGVRAVLGSRYTRTAAVTAMAAVILTSNFILDSPAPEIVYKAF